MPPHWLTTSEIEKQIAGYALRFDACQDDEIEWRYQPPPFVIAFSAFLETFQRVPTQAEFKNYYLEKNGAALHAEFEHKWRDASTRQQKKRALLARLDRAYPSFVRDVYLLALLRENGIAATYDPACDVAGGVDMSVTANARQIQVHVFLDSPRARQGRAKKDRRHHFTGEHFDLVVRRAECKIVGAFWLPTLTHVERIKARMEMR